MSRIEITRTELVWPGKYDDEGNLVPPRRVHLPLQVTERANETRATREQRQVKAAKQLFRELGVDYRVVTDQTVDWWEPDEE